MPTEHSGGCHCGNIQVQVRLTRPPSDVLIRSCACPFCRSHGTRTVSDPAGQADVWASDWDLVQRYRFGSRTADYLLCRRCGVYVGAVCETPSGQRTCDQYALPRRSRDVYPGARSTRLRRRRNQGALGSARSELDAHRDTHGIVQSLQT